MNGSLGEIFKIVFIILSVYGVLYLLCTGIKFPTSLMDTRSRKRSSDSLLEREAREIQHQIDEEAKKRELKLDKLGMLAKKNPERLASTLQRWILENNGKHAH